MKRSPAAAAAAAIGRTWAVVLWSAIASTPMPASSAAAASAAGSQWEWCGVAMVWMCRSMFMRFRIQDSGFRIWVLRLNLEAVTSLIEMNALSTLKPCGSPAPET
jgi:hypothetical protein